MISCILQHSLKIWTLKICTTESIVNIFFDQCNVTMLLYEVTKQTSLIAYTIAFHFISIIFGKSHI